MRPRNLWLPSLLVCLFTLSSHRALAAGQTISPGETGTAPLPGFRKSSNLDEQELTFRFDPEIRVHINAPGLHDFDAHRPVEIVLYALPNGNTIEQTAGKRAFPGDDWHFNIQHIAAQTRFLRRHIDEYNLVVVYLETVQKSWPAWREKHPENTRIIGGLIDSLMHIVDSRESSLTLSGHSGGGSFIFGYLDGIETIPAHVDRISFLDSNYGYQERFAEKIARWLQDSGRHHLSVIAYNDSIALYEGKPVVSPTGGTWRRSKMMLQDLSRHFTFSREAEDGYSQHEALDGRAQFILIDNPERKILHTVLVERNGFIHSLLSGTESEGVGYSFWGDRAYGEFILGEMPGLRPLTIPPRPPDAISGSACMEVIKHLSFENREQRLLEEISQGNIPDFLRSLVTVESVFEDAAGGAHAVRYQVMPDYLAVGSDRDFCRVPLGPRTAQRLADLFAAGLPTRKLVDDIYRHAAVKLEPVAYVPVGDANERVEKFVEHNSAIEDQRIFMGGTLGHLVAGIKKDLVISHKIADPARTHHVVIYGWHRPDGQPIQPLTNVHIDTYVDYSHGVRLMNSEVMIDGVPMDMAEVLKDTCLYRLVSDEEGPLERTRY